MKTYKIITTILAIAFAAQLSIEIATASTIVTQTGYASPQNEDEKNNVERLRERAIRNALDLAVMQVTGAAITGQRSDSIHTSENYTSTPDSTAENVKLDSAFRGSSLSRTSGHVRLVEITNEGFNGQQYFVEIKAEVSSDNDLTNISNAGYFWNRAGRPVITLVFSETVNKRSTSSPSNRTEIYFRENISNNGIQLTTDSNNPEYQIKLSQTIDIKTIQSLGAYTSSCSLGYRILGRDGKTTLAEERFNNGQSAGFTTEQSKEACLRPLAPVAVEKLIRSLANIVNDQWNNGSEYSVVINNLPGQYFETGVTALATAFGITELKTRTFDQNRLNASARFKGDISDLVNAVLLSFEDVGHKLEIETYQGYTLAFRWIAEVN